MIYLHLIFCSGLHLLLATEDGAAVFIGCETFSELTELVKSGAFKLFALTDAGWLDDTLGDTLQGVWHNILTSRKLVAWQRWDTLLKSFSSYTTWLWQSARCIASFFFNGYPTRLIWLSIIWIFNKIWLPIKLIWVIRQIDVIRDWHMEWI